MVLKKNQPKQMARITMNIQWKRSHLKKKPYLRNLRKRFVTKQGLKNTSNTGLSLAFDYVCDSNMASHQL
jgi:hypothetical protein